MILTNRIRLRPTPEQESALWKSTGTARWVYNWSLARQEENHKKGNKFISDNDLRKEITQIKKQDDFIWLGKVSNNVAKQAVKDACDAYKKFFKGLADKPRFKSRKKSKPSFYNDNLKLKSKPNKLVLIEKIGWVKTSEQLSIDIKYMNPRVGFDGKYWYLTVGIEQEVVKPELTDVVVGIDLGVKDLAICSDGKVFKNINKTQAVRKTEKQLRRLQRRASRKYEMNKEGNRFVKTSNLIKIEKQIRHLHRRLTSIRDNYIHQTQIQL